MDWKKHLSEDDVPQGLSWEHKLATLSYPNQVNFHYKSAPQKLKPMGEYGVLFLKLNVYIQFN